MVFTITVGEYTAKPNKRHALISKRKRATKNIMKENRRVAKIPTERVA